MPNTPPGYTTMDFLFCWCPTEADRMLCCAGELSCKIGHATRVVPPAVKNDPGPFQMWMYQLSIDLSFAPPVIGFRAIMEDWSRARILLNLRRRGATKL